MATWHRRVSCVAESHGVSLLCRSSGDLEELGAWKAEAPVDSVRDPSTDGDRADNRRTKNLI